MNELLQSLLGALKGTSPASKVIALLVGLGLVAVLGVTSWVASEPHFELAFSQLSDYELARVARALSEADVAFETSQPPGPFNLYVDRDERSKALAAAYGAGALDRSLKGILAESGMSTVFMSADEREQMVKKREWEEMEGMLEELDFIVKARVRTSGGESSPLAVTVAPPITASVTLAVAGSEPLSAERARTVATLVGRGLGVERENITISDQSGATVWEGERETSGDEAGRDLLALKTEYDRAEGERANRLLSETLGPSKARVTINSLWNFDHAVTRTDTTSKGAPLSESKTSTVTPIASVQPVGGPAGVSSNVALDPAAPASPSSSSAPESQASTSDETRTDYKPSTKSEERVRSMPELVRLSVALFLDESVATSQVASLEEAIKAAVGFDETRGDVFSTVSLAFPVAATSTEGAGDSAGDGTTKTTGTPAQEPSPLIGKLIERSVEIVAAVVFLLLLFKSLKSARASAAAQAAAEARSAEPAVDAELLARAQVEELLKAEPEKVGQILSSWARGESTTVGAKG
jgi:flagellar M-ring protein FliF